MKINVPEQVAAGALAQLGNSTHPDVRHLVRELGRMMKRGDDTIITADEWEAVLVAVDEYLVAGDTLKTIDPEERMGLHSATHEQRNGRLRTARPKVERLMQRQLLREEVG